MAALDFKDRAACLTYLTTALPGADVSVLEALLDASAGNDCGNPPTTVYRPFWVQSDALGTNPAQQYESVTSAAGSSVKYRDTADSIRSGLMRRQALLDASLCGIPEGYEATSGNEVRVVF